MLTTNKKSPENFEIHWSFTPFAVHKPQRNIQFLLKPLNAALNAAISAYTVILFYLQLAGLVEPAALAGHTAVDRTVADYNPVDHIVVDAVVVHMESCNFVAVVVVAVGCSSWNFVDSGSI